ncbi:MAG TPA: PIN domain-containing protein [Actinomycetota bacterium]
MALAVVFDANVLYGIALTDFFITAAAKTRFYRMCWSSGILEEVARNLEENRPDLGDRVRRRIDQMERAVPEAMVEPPQELIDSMTNDPKDRHVLAAAVVAEAAILVTFNLSDFPADACDPHGVKAQHPDEFTRRLVTESASGVLDALEEMAGRKTSPPRTVDEIIDRLAQELPSAMRTLREREAWTRR